MKWSEASPLQRTTLIRMRPSCQIPSLISAASPQTRAHMIVSMMLNLMFDVINQRILVGTAHAKGAITLLPGEVQSMLVEPSRRVRL